MKVCCHRAALLSIGLIVCLTGFAAYADATRLQTYEGPEYGAFFDLVQSEDGNIVVAGTTHHSQFPTTEGEVLVAKLSPEGEMIWERTRGGAALDQGLYVEAMVDGSYLVLGESDSFGAGERDLYLLKYDSEGTLLWEKTFGGEKTEWAKEMISLSDGNYLLVGESNSYSESFDVYLVKIDVDGNEIWSATIGDDENESGSAALEDDNGDLLILAVISYSGGASVQYRDTRLFRLDSAGNIIWNRLYRGEQKQAGDAMAWTEDGDIVIAGLSETDKVAYVYLDYWLAKADGETGELIWSKIEGSQYRDDYGLAIAALGGDDFLVSGLGQKFPLLKLNADGTIYWAKSAVDAGTRVYGGFGAIVTEPGVVVISGFAYTSTGDDRFDAVLLEVDVEALDD